MADDRILRSIVDKCDFLFDDALLSEETIIEQYLTFFARQFEPTERSISFAFHTGSLCFDVVSVAALMIGCLAYEFSSNDEILAGLSEGDLVLFKGERYRWCGIEKISFIKGQPKVDYIILEQDGKGKNGKSTRNLPYESNKHLIKPYFGSSSVTDGRGVRKENTNRTDFISYILEVPPEDVPTSLDLSVVVVADKNEFAEICRHLRIRYNGNKTVELTDIVPVAYYTGNGECFQIGKNASKAEAVIKVTGKMSMARDLVLDRSGNRAIGLLVTNVESLSANAAELNDLLRRRSLKFAYVIGPFNAESCELAVEQYETAKMFACTRELLSGSQHEIKYANKLTAELNRQVSNILSKKTNTVRVEGCWSWEQYKRLKEKLFAIKQSNWSGEDRDGFILSAIALLNLFNTAFFSMKCMENAISEKRINLAVESPEARITELMEIATRTMYMRDQCIEIVSSLLEMYSALSDFSPKGTALSEFLKNHTEERIALIVPKAYYTDIFTETYQNRFVNVSCLTANRFDKQNQYDIIVTVGDIIGKRFDAIHCFAAPEITMFLYDCEEKTFSFRKKKSEKSERKLNARIRGLRGETFNEAIKTEDREDPDITEETVREFSDLDGFVEAMGMFDIRKVTAKSGNQGDAVSTAEVNVIGVFTTGERILFSKYYSAVVFDQNKGEVSEKSPEKLEPGDILVFTKRNDYTSNIVDQIFEQLMRAKKLSAEVQDAAEKAFYWKAILREYKEKNNLTYRAIARELQKHGSSLQEVTVRQWLIEESHIIGPRDEKTMKLIAEITQDPYLLGNSYGYFEACRIIRHFRREILSLIAQAINDKLSNKQPVHGSAFEVAFENVEKLSETMELESVYSLDEVAVVPSGIVNRPISDSEVLM